MKKILFIGLILIISLTAMAQNKTGTYRSLWKQVEAFEKESLPTSATKVVDEILDLSIKDKNRQQTIKALIYKGKYNEQIESSNHSYLIDSFEKELANAKDDSEKSLLSSMLAQVYLSAYAGNSWNINALTPIAGKAPNDVKEWSKNIYVDKIQSLLKQSIANPKQLLGKRVDEYDILVTRGTYIESNSTLYDLFALRAINIASELSGLDRSRYDLNVKTSLTPDQLTSPASEYIKLVIPNKYSSDNFEFSLFQDYMQSLSERNMTHFLAFAEIQKMELVARRSKQLNDGAKADKYKNLLALYGDNEASIDIRLALISAMSEGSPMYISRQVNLDVPKLSSDNNGEIYAICKEGIKQYPNYSRTKELENKIKEIEAPRIVFSSNGLYHSNDEIKVRISHKNLQALKSENHLVLANVSNKAPELVKDLGPTNLISKLSYTEDHTELDLGKLSHGKYQLVYIQNNNTKQSFKSKVTQAIKERNYVEFTVSDLATFYKSVDKKTSHIYVVDNKNGQPVAQANVSVYMNEGSEKKTLVRLKTNDDGLAIYNDTLTGKARGYNEIEYAVATNGDKNLPNIRIYNRHTYSTDQSQEIKPTTSILTDRSVYRPGQIIHFKTIVVDKDKHVMVNRKLSVKLMNPNGEEVSKIDIKTNEFGSASGEFVAPKGGLVGMYTLSSDDAYNYVSVEEYKRPTFLLAFDKLQGSYTFGQAVTVSGTAKTYSGVSLQNSSVTYSIQRTTPYAFFWRASSPTTVGNGSTQTDKNGKFEIAFTPEDADTHQPQLLRNKNSIYTFEVTATITDVNGETQSATFPLTVGNVSMMLTTDIPQMVDKDSKTAIKIEASNLSGEPIMAKGSYKLHTLNEKDSIVATVHTGKFESGEQAKLRETLQSAKSGKYRIELIALDDKDREVNSTKDFVLYSFGDSKPPVDSRNWLLEKDTKFATGKDAEIIYGISDTDGYVLYEIYNNDKVFERKFLKLSNENRTFKIDYKSEYGDGVYVGFTRIWNNGLVTDNVLIAKEEEKDETKLVINLDTFRDKLLPGEKESWKISVKDTNGKPVQTEVLASMYDIALDKIAGYNRWVVNMPYNPIMSLSAEYYSSNYFNAESRAYINLKGIDGPGRNAKDRTFADINWFGYSLNSFGVSLKGIAINRSNSSIRIRGAAKAPSLGEPSIETEAVADQQADAGGMGYAPESPSVQMRENFNETAFFYPHLTTNKDGETLVSFTVPESTTTWRFRLLAHDANSRTAEAEKSVVTSKKLMVSPNMPRFFRQGDQTSIAARISNLSEEAISGNVSIEFFDPATDKVIDLKIKDQSQAFGIEADESTSAIWTFTVPADIEMLGCRVVALGDGHSDGEQHALAVLPNRMLVTETLPFDVVDKGENAFTLDKLANSKSSTRSNYKLTLEYSNSPAWYAIMALPTMATPTNENAVSWFASYYTNALGSSIVAQYPKVAAMIKAWQKEGGDEKTLVSQLNKNEELKAVLLEETPWVLDAKNEEEQMQKLSLLFDLNNTQSKTQLAINKLQELQSYNGGWSWYQGMKESRAITTYILHGLSQLQLAGQVEHPEQVKVMYMNAIKYLDDCLVQDFENMKKSDTNWAKRTGISTQQLEYMYTRSFYRDIPIAKEAREAERHYTSVVSKNSALLPLYEKSLLAVLLKRNGGADAAGKLAQSIKEHSVTDKTKGMYWPNSKSYAFLSMSTISAHTFLMDALRENGATTAEIDAMKQWLVKQKQTQAWEATHATVYAISSLLRGGSDWFANAETMPTIKVGSKTVDTTQASKGTGYVKTSWTAAEIDKTMAKVNVNTNNTTPAYGAMYWQYYEDLNKITEQKGDLNIDKQLYIKTTTNKGEVITAVSSKNPIKVGDLVTVRLTIRNDRAMEFVHIKDMRAASFEPTQTSSGMVYEQGVSYYRATKDASTNFYIDYLAKGTYVLEYSVYANRSGSYSNGITSIQCLYAPEFSSHTQGINVVITE